MNRSKREENGIIIHFTFYFILTILLVLFVVSNIFPRITEIEAKKETTRNLYNTIQRVDKSGISFTEFRVLTDSGDSNRVVSEILKNMTTDFYSDNLVNTTSASYKDFLETKQLSLNSEENKEKVAKNISRIREVLPSYSENAVDLGEDNVLTDYKFVNYVESILESFNLSTNSSIGIGKVVLLKDFSTGESLDSNIFYIPLNLTLIGTKRGIIEFLYFIENVGNISVEGSDIYLNTDDSFLSKNGIKKVLEGDRYSRDYNIFEKQIVDIDRISMKNYIDSSYISRKTKDLKDFIIKTQGNDNFEINVILKFYVKGQPTYKIEEFITNVLNKHKEVQGLVNLELKKTNLNAVEVINLKKDNNTLKELNKEVLNIRKELKIKDKLEELYKRSIVIEEVITPIYNKLKK